MSNREVKKTRKDTDGDIVALCGDNGDYWSPRQKADAINDIESGRHTYHVDGTEIHVVKGENGKYLRTDPDATEKNNLDDLPDC